MTTFSEAFAELMTRFDENRELWIAAHNGKDAGFNEWFTAQVKGVG